MGILSRSTTLMRYYTKGKVEGSFWDSIANGVEQGRFKQVDNEFSDIVGFGWTSIDDFSDTELKNTPYTRGDYVALALRIDSARVPAKTLALTVKEEVTKYQELSGQNRISSAQRREIKERVKKSLKAQALATIQVHDVAWDTTSNVVYFTSHSAKIREHFEDHFKKSFGVTLVPAIACIVAENVAASEEIQADAFGELKSCLMSF